MPQIDGEVLGKTKEEAAALNKFIADEFALFGNTPECDWNRRSTFAQLQDLVFTNQCISGDVLVTLPMKERLGAVYATKIRLIEADRVSNPWGAGREGETAAGGPLVFGGVELSADGEVVAYWVARKHPASAVLGGLIGGNPMLDPSDFERIPAFGPETGRPIALLIGEMERPEQRRAVPMFAKCLTELKNLSRYIESTTVQNVIKSYFTAFVTSAMPSTEMFSGLINDDAIADLVQRNPYHVQAGTRDHKLDAAWRSDHVSHSRRAGKRIRTLYHGALQIHWRGVGHSIRGFIDGIQRQLFRQPRKPLAVLGPREGDAPDAGRPVLPACF